MNQKGNIHILFVVFSTYRLLLKILIRNLWFGETIKEAIDSPRIHHQLFPMTFQYEKGFPLVKKKLKKKTAVDLIDIDPITI